MMTRNNCQRVLIGFFPASPSPNKMWICDGDRASGILLSFKKEITASECRRFIGSIGCTFKFKFKKLFHIEFEDLHRNFLFFARVSWNQLLLEHFNVSPKKTKATISNFPQHAGGWSTRQCDHAMRHQMSHVTNSGKWAPGWHCHRQSPNFLAH